MSGGIVITDAFRSVGMYEVIPDRDVLLIAPLSGFAPVQLVVNMSNVGAPVELPELKPDTDTWKNAVKHMAENGIALDKVQSKYSISDENKIAILKDVSNMKQEIKTDA